jgi:hypothetical protein
MMWNPALAAGSGAEVDVYFWQLIAGDIIKSLKQAAPG